MTRVPSGPIIPTGNVPPAAGWEAVTAVEGLEYPWSVTWLPEGQALITEKPGRLRVVRKGQLLPSVVDGLAEFFAGGHAGLMDVSLHPQFSNNRWVYLTYSAGTEQANSTRLARGRLSEDLSTLSDLEVLHVVTPLKPKFHHFGSRLLWLPDGTVLLALGDGGNPPVRLDGELMREQSQQLDSQLGKVLRLRDDGTVPADNPFVGREGVDPFIWTWGHRNIQGLVRDPVTGRVWANEHGSRGGDELNVLVAGGNYGWPRVTYSIEYTFGVISRERTRPDMVDPVVVWTPAQAPSGLLLYTGKRFPEWQGDLFSGALKGREVRRIDLDNMGRVIRQQRLPIGARVRDVRQGPDGFIYVLTDEEKGRMLRLQPRPAD
ncbi:MAG: PQQ-dependent sugar dehydrogenase [Synoicihabitans sp.]